MSSRCHLHSSLLREQHERLLRVHFLLHWISADHGAFGCVSFGAAECTGVQGETNGAWTPVAACVLSTEARAEIAQVPFATSGENVHSLMIKSVLDGFNGAEFLSALCKGKHISFSVSRPIKSLARKPADDQ